MLIFSKGQQFSIPVPFTEWLSSGDSMWVYKVKVVKDSGNSLWCGQALAKYIICSGFLSCKIRSTARCRIVYM